MLNTIFSFVSLYFGILHKFRILWRWFSYFSGSTVCSRCVLSLCLASAPALFHGYRVMWAQLYAVYPCPLVYRSLEIERMGLHIQRMYVCMYGVVAVIYGVWWRRRSFRCSGGWKKTCVCSVSGGIAQTTGTNQNCYSRTFIKLLKNVLRKCERQMKYGSWWRWIPH
jgi:hypothetical protein